MRATPDPVAHAQGFYAQTLLTGQAGEAGGGDCAGCAMKTANKPLCRR